MCWIFLFSDTSLNEHSDGILREYIYDLVQIWYKFPQVEQILLTVWPCDLYKKLPLIKYSLLVLSDMKTLFSSSKFSRL